MVWEQEELEHEDEPFRETPLDFDFLSLSSKPKDYYKILELDYDASEEMIRSNYIRLALKWHPDKRKDEDNATSRFQDINEAYEAQSMLQWMRKLNNGYEILSDPDKRREYDRKGLLYIPDYNVMEYLNRFKGLILTCNGLGIRYSIF